MAYEVKPNTETLCPICGASIKAYCYEDRSVGIFFDFDVCVGSGCECDFDDEATYQTIAKHVEEAWLSNMYKGRDADAEFEIVK